LYPVGKATLCDVALEQRSVDLDHRAGHTHLVICDLDRVSEGAAKLMQRVAQRLARLVLIALAPEQ
jgi:hypothetical protein